MTLKRIVEYLGGYVRIRVRGKNPERLVNLCLSSGFPVWDLSYTEGKVYFSTSPSKYKDIRPLARKARCVPKIVERRGLPFFFAKVKKRPGFIWSSIILLTMFLYLSGSVWGIQVKGNNKVSQEQILEVAAREGLRVGARKSYISQENIQEALTLEIPELSWAYVHFQGTMAVIEVVEKVRPETLGPGDVVAKKDGIVESILVLSGIPLVKPGQTVRKGEILIAGRSSGPMQGARGMVTAKTWYQVEQEIPIQQIRPVRTGRTIEAKIVKVKGREFPLWGFKKLFDWYEIEDYPIKKIPEGPDGALIEIINRMFFEVKWEEVEISPDKVLATAVPKARQIIENQLPPSVELIELNYETKVVDESFVLVRVTACALEEIGELRPWPSKETREKILDKKMEVDR